MANSARRLSLMQIQGANSGHPGAPLGAADIITTLYANHLRFDPLNPAWPGRDRFVLSMGHASSLLYSVLHLAGYAVSLKDLQGFRKLGSKTPGHPEVGTTPGVEATTGPLGQGLAMAAGMAVAARKNKSDSRIYVMCSDGDLMEGVAQETISFAGLQKLSNLIVFWDDNEISIDGRAQSADDRLERFKAAKWNAFRIDGHDPAAIDAAILAAKKSSQPTFIACRTKIGLGSKMEGTNAVHGAPLKPDDAAQLMEKLERESDDSLWKKIKTGNNKSKPNKENKYKIVVPNITGVEATRVISGKVLEDVMKKRGNEIVGASADLATSTNVLTGSTSYINPKNPAGNFIEFGVREHLMAAAMNGINLSGKKTFCSTFLVFSDYMRPAVRLAAIMKVPQIFVFSHDSIGMGEDGETHQPVEQLESLRAMPNLNVFRPASAAEVAFAWEYALNSKATPSVISLSRQKFRLAPDVPAAKIAKGGYILKDAKGRRHITIIATGSEVAVAIGAAEILAGEKINAAVVSMPCVELFRAQPKKYQGEILGGGKIVSVEAGATRAWREFAGVNIGIDTFGLSGSAGDLMSRFGFTAEKVAAKILSEIGD
jgi:transketolase